MSSSRESLSALISTRGKDGAVSAVAQASVVYGADSTLHPADFAGAVGSDADKALVALGGFIVHQFKLAPKVVVSMRQTLSAKYDDICGVLDLDKEAFVAELSAIEAQVISDIAKDQNLKKQLGIHNSGYILSGLKSLGKIQKDSPLSPVARYNLQLVIERAQAALDFVTVQEMVTDSELVNS